MERKKTSSGAGPRPDYVASMPKLKGGKKEGNSQNKCKSQTMEATEIACSSSEEEEEKEKLRLQGKTVHLSAVPRKARTAISRRPLPSSHVSPSSPLSYTNSASHIALKPAKRMKKGVIKASKVVKDAVTISEQEVEVAAVLFGLARMVPSALTPSELAEERTGYKPAITAAHESISSSIPLTCAFALPTSSPVVVSAVSYMSAVSVPMVEAPKRKRPRVKPRLEVGELQQSESEGPDRIGLKADNSIAAPTGSLMGATISEMVEMQIPAMLATPSTIISPSEINKNSDTGMEKISSGNLLRVSLAQQCTSGSILMEYKGINVDYVSDGPALKDREMAIAYTCDPIRKVEETNARCLLAPTNLCSSQTKGDIVIMAPPEGSMIGTVDNPLDFSGRDAIALSNNAEGASNTQVTGPKERDLRLSCKDGSTLKSKVGGDVHEVEDKKKERNVDSGEREGPLLHSSEAAVKCENVEEEIYVGNLASSELCSNCRMTDLELVKKEKANENGCGTFEPAASPSANNVPSSDNVSTGMVDWPGAISPYGCHSPAAAASAMPARWSTMTPFNGASSTNRHINPTMQVSQVTYPDAQLRSKRCATHIYIAQLTSLHQQMLRRQPPLCHASYNNPTLTGPFGANLYNLNMPLLPAEMLYGSGLGNLLGAATISGSGSREAGLNSGLASTKTTASFSAVRESDEKAAVQQSSSFLQQAGVGFGVSSMQIGSSVKADSASSHGSGACDSTCTSSIGKVGTLNNASTGVNNSIIDAAAAQAQLLQTMIQQTTFPFLSPPPFGPLNGSSLVHSSQQQAGQCLGNPYFNSHLSHHIPQTQQIQMPSELPKQQHHSPPINVQTCVAAAAAASPFESQSHHNCQGLSSPHLPKKTEREPDFCSTAESKIHRNAYSDVVVSGQHPSLPSSQPFAFGLGIAGGKMSGNVELESSGCMQAHLPISNRQQKQPSCRQNQGVSSKSYDAYSSQVKGSVSPSPLGHAIRLHAPSFTQSSLQTQSTATAGVAHNSCLSGGWAEESNIGEKRSSDSCVDMKRLAKSQSTANSGVQSSGAHLFFSQGGLSSSNTPPPPAERPGMARPKLLPSEKLNTFKGGSYQKSSAYVHQSNGASSLGKRSALSIPPSPPSLTPKGQTQPNIIQPLHQHNQISAATSSQQQWGNWESHRDQKQGDQFSPQSPVQNIHIFMQAPWHHQSQQFIMSGVNLKDFQQNPSHKGHSHPSLMSTSFKYASDSPAPPPPPSSKTAMLNGLGSLNQVDSSKAGRSLNQTKSLVEGQRFGCVSQWTSNPGFPFIHSQLSSTSAQQTASLPENVASIKTPLAPNCSPSMNQTDGISTGFGSLPLPRPQLDGQDMDMNPKPTKNGPVEEDNNVPCLPCGMVEVKSQ